MTTLPRWAPWALGGLFAVAYALTPPAVPSSDSIAFVRVVRAGVAGTPLYFQAEHLLWPGIGGLLASLAWLGPFPPLGALRLVSALAGGAAVGLMVLLAAARLPKRPIAALAAAAALGASFGSWFHATEGEDQVLANAAALAAFIPLFTGARLVRGWLPTAAGWLVVVGFAFAILVHATAVLLAAPVVVLLWGRPIREWAALTAPLLLLILVPYAFVAVTVVGIGSAEQLQRWVLAAPGQGIWGQVSPRNLWTGMVSLGAAALPVPGRWAGVALPADFERVAFTAAASVAVAAVGSAIAVAARGRTRVQLALAVWIGAIVLFGAYWAPEDPQFWLLALPPALLLLAEAVPDRALLGIAAGLLLVSVGLGVLPRMDASRAVGLASAQCVAERMAPTDLLVAPGWDWAGDLVPFVSDRAVLSLNDEFVLGAKRDRAAFLLAVDSRIAKARQAGGRVYLARLDTMTADEAAFFMRVTGMTAADFPWRRTDAFTCGAERIAEIAS